MTMTQRPIVTLIVERIEVPVGFRAKGPNNRLIVVEGIGDMVMRNGKRMVCLKLRRDDANGLEYTPVAKDLQNRQWQVPSPIPGKNGGIIGGDYTQVNSGQGGNGFLTPIYTQDGNGGVNISYKPNFNGGDFDYSQMQHITNNRQYAPVGSLGNMGKDTSKLMFADNSNISIELGTDSDVNKLENLWATLSKKYSDTLRNYEPFFSVDASADGQGKELFHLRVGPVDSLETGDDVCSRLGRNGVFCSVVRTQ